MFLEPETSATRGAPERQELNRPGCFHAGHLFDAIENPIEGRDSRLGRTHAEKHSHRDSPIGLESEIDPTESRERSQQEPCADQEHDRQSDLRHHQ